MKTTTIAILFCLSFTAGLFGDIIFSDDFNGSTINTNLWRTPTWEQDRGEVYTGQTRFESWFNKLPIIGNSKVSITAQSWDGWGFEISGTDLISNTPFYVGSGLTITAMLKVDTIKKGTICTFSLRDVPSYYVWEPDEISFEFVGNQPSYFNTNIDSNEAQGEYLSKYIQYADAGRGITTLHKYQIQWLPSQVSWYVDDVLVRTVTSAESPIPQGPMYLHFNMWAPDDDRTDAFSNELLISKTRKKNEIWSMSVDSVHVYSNEKQSLAYLETNPSDSLEIGVSGTQGFEVSAIDQNQNSIITPLSVTWRSNNRSVAKIDQNGLLTALSPGVANITASCGSAKSHPIIVTVPAKSIVIRSVPAYGQMGRAKGVVNGLAPGNYHKFRIATYIHVNSWWTKPTFAYPTVSISKKGLWSANITTGGVDEHADEIRAYLIPKNIEPPICSDDQYLPTSLNEYLYDSVSRREPLVPRILGSMVLVTKPASLILGGQPQRIIVEPRDIDNEPVSVGIKWLSKNPKVVTVDTKGLVTPVGKGTATITARAITNSKIRLYVWITVK